MMSGTGETLADSCMHCGTIMQIQEQHYALSDLGPELNQLIEKSNSSMAISGDTLCEGCFSGFLSRMGPQHRSNADSHCCVCHRSLLNRRTHTLPHGPERDILTARVYPNMIPVDALICFNCWSKVRHTTRANSHANICVEHPRCIDCCRILSNCRFQLLEEGPERDYIRSKISPRQMPNRSRICYNCWRHARYNLQLDTERNVASDGDQSGTIIESEHQERHENADIQISDHHNDTFYSGETTSSSSNSAPSELDHPPQTLCIWCNVSLSGIQSHNLTAGAIRNEIEIRIAPREVTPISRACHACWMAARRNTERQEATPVQQTNIVLEVFKRTINSSNSCFVPDCRNTERYHVPGYLRKRLLTDYKLYVTTNARVCEVHKTSYNWEGIENFPFSSTFTNVQIEEMLHINNEHPHSDFLDFNNVQNMPENVLHYWTGRTHVEYMDMLSQIPMLQENCTKPKIALGLYLMKLRTGDSNERLSSLFRMSESTICRLITKARRAIVAQFVPRHLGVGRLDRQTLLQSNLIIPKGLFGDDATVIAIFDGTYVYVQKSSNYSFQKKSYSLHKYKNLLKPFMVVSTDGYILDVFGPYAAKTSDADIMKSLFQNEGNQLRQFFRPNDAFILDRGFRDAIPFLNSLNYKVYKPESLQEGETQLPTVKANKSRCVTLCRWVVEVVNGRFKRDYKLFRQEYFNAASTHLMDDFRIGAAIINAYHKRIENRSDAVLILNRALRYLNIPNYLGQYVIENNINRLRANFQSIDGDVPEIVFPQMTKSDLIIFALGIYHMKQARSYYGEHIRENGNFIIEIASNINISIVPGLLLPQSAKLIRGRIKSRHTSRRIYFTYVLINEEVLHSWSHSILGYCCSCLSGLRTVGCCGHVMTIVWYLGWARHQERIDPPASFLDHIIEGE